MKYREIAATLRKEAQRWPEGVESENTYTYAIGTLKITCLASREAILAVADKFERGTHTWRGMHRKRAKSNPLTRPHDADAQLAALEKECV